MKFKTISVLTLFLFTLFTINIIHAETIDESSFYKLGIDNIIILKDQNICTDINIKDISDSENSIFVLQLEIENYIPVNSGVEFNFYLNNIKEYTLKNNNIKKNNIIKLYNYKKNQENTLKICVDNTFLPKIIISKNSKVGQYLLSEILESNFRQIIPTNIETDSLVPVKLIVKNTGYAPVFINLKNAKNKYLENTDLQNTSGQTSYEGLLDAHDSIEIIYYIKTDKDTKFISPRAYLTYTDEFGKDVELKTDIKIINTNEKTVTLEAFIDIPKEIITKEEYQGKIILRNISEDLIEDIYITANFDSEIEFSNSNLLKINKNDIIEIPFKIKSLENKTQKLNFEIEYHTNNSKHILGTEVIDIISKPKTNFISEIIGSLTLLFIITYIWILKV